MKLFKRRKKKVDKEIKSKINDDIRKIKEYLNKYNYTSNLKITVVNILDNERSYNIQMKYGIQTMTYHIENVEGCIIEEMNEAVNNIKFQGRIALELMESEIQNDIREEKIKDLLK